MVHPFEFVLVYKKKGFCKLNKDNHLRTNNLVKSIQFTIQKKTKSK